MFLSRERERVTLYTKIVKNLKVIINHLTRSPRYTNNFPFPSNVITKKESNYSHGHHRIESRSQIIRSCNAQR